MKNSQKSRKTGKPRDKNRIQNQGRGNNGRSGLSDKKESHHGVLLTVGQHGVSRKKQEKTLGTLCSSVYSVVNYSFWAPPPSFLIPLVWPLILIAVCDRYNCSCGFCGIRR